MINKKIERLIIRYIDGDVTPSEKLFIEKALNEDGEVSKYYEKMKKLDEILTENATQTESVDLKNEILDEIHRSEAKGAQRRRGNIWEKLAPTTGWRIAYAFVMGIIIGFLLFSPIFKPKQASDILDQEVGTIYDMESKVAFTLPINITGVTADVSAHYLANDFIKIAVELNSVKQIKTKFSYNKNNFEIWNLRIAKEHAECNIISGYNYVEIINTGENSYIVLLKKLNDLEDEIKLEMFSFEGLLYEDRLQIKNN